METRASDRVQKIKWILPTKFNVFCWLAALNSFVGIFYLGWKTETILFSFAFEGFVIGFVHFFKMWIVFFWGETQQKTTSNRYEKSATIGAIFGTLIVFLLFSLAHLVFMFVFLMAHDREIENPLLLIENTVYVFSKPPLVVSFLSGTFLFIASQFSSLIREKKYHQYALKHLHVQPYYRILAQQLLIIVGGYLFMLFDDLTAIALCVVLIRFLYENLLIGAQTNQKIRSFLFRLLIPRKDQHNLDSIKSFDAFLKF